MKPKEYLCRLIEKSEKGTRFLEDKRYRVITKAVLILIFNLLFAFYNAILGITTASIIFIASALYYFLLSSMRFSAVILERKNKEQSDRKTASVIGIMLMVLGIIFHTMVFISIKYQTASSYGTITMITIATFTFVKIAAAVVTALRHRKDCSVLYKAVNAIRYSEVAVSLLTMQQSMLVSFNKGEKSFDIIINALTGAGVFVFIFTLGIITLKSARKERE